MRSAHSSRFSSPAVALSIALGLPLTPFAQSSSPAPVVSRPDRGFLPAGVYSLSQTESVNDSTGTVTLRIPLAKLNGRNGSSFSLDLIYNSALYNLQTKGATQELVKE